MFSIGIASSLWYRRATPPQWKLKTAADFRARPKFREARPFEDHRFLPGEVSGSCCAGARTSGASLFAPATN